MDRHIVSDAGSRSHVRSLMDIAIGELDAKEVEILRRAESATGIGVITDILSEAGARSHLLYGLVNEREFLSNAFSRKGFQEFLKGVKVEDESGNVKKGSLWERFVLWVNDVLFGGVDHTTLLHKAIETGADVIDRQSAERHGRLDAQDGVTDKIKPEAKAEDSYAINDNLDKIGQLYDSTVENKKQRRFLGREPLNRVSLGKVSDNNVQAVKKATGIDLVGYERTIDNNFINHVLKRHSDPKTEAARGQIAVTKEDIQRIPEIVESPDDIFYGGKTNVGRDAILYKKRFNGETYYLEEVRTGKNQIAATTLYKISRGTSDMPSGNESPAHTSETLPPTSTVPHPGESVNVQEVDATLRVLFERSQDSDVEGVESYALGPVKQMRDRGKITSEQYEWVKANDPDQSKFKYAPWIAKQLSNSDTPEVRDKLKSVVGDYARFIADKRMVPDFTKAPIEKIRGLGGKIVFDKHPFPGIESYDSVSAIEKDYRFWYLRNTFSPSEWNHVVTTGEGLHPEKDYTVIESNDKYEIIKPYTRQAFVYFARYYKVDTSVHFDDVYDFSLPGMSATWCISNPGYDNGHYWTEYNTTEKKTFYYVYDKSLRQRYAVEVSPNVHDRLVIWSQNNDIKKGPGSKLSDRSYIDSRFVDLGIDMSGFKSDYGFHSLENLRRSLDKTVSETLYGHQLKDRYHIYRNGVVIYGDFQLTSDMINRSGKVKVPILRIDGDLDLSYIGRRIPSVSELYFYEESLSEYDIPGTVIGSVKELSGLPDRIGGSLIIRGANLATLRGVPSNVGHNVDISILESGLKTLADLPKHIGGDLRIVSGDNVDILGTIPADGYFGGRWVNHFSSRSSFSSLVFRIGENTIVVPSFFNSPSYLELRKRGSFFDLQYFFKNISDVLNRSKGVLSDDIKSFVVDSLSQNTSEFLFSLDANKASIPNFHKVESYVKTVRDKLFDVVSGLSSSEVHGESYAIRTGDVDVDLVMSKVSLSNRPDVVPLSKRFSELAHRVYTNVVDRYHPIKRFVDDIERSISNPNNPPIDKSVKDNPYIRASLFSGIASQVDAMLTYRTWDYKGPNNTFQWTGKGLKEILEPVFDPNTYLRFTS
ncbi:MAG: hypothetical protein HQL61_17435 [Magnetococcales bacterium]|nr:hypothetical protein [Nitrospirota bacterium]